MSSSESLPLIPAKAGIQGHAKKELGPGFRGDERKLSDAERIAQLEERVAELEAALGMTAVVPDEALMRARVKITHTEAQLLGLLLRRPWISHEAAFVALYGDRPEAREPSPNIISVFLSKVRKKLRPHGIEIESVFGRGFRMAPAMRTRAAALFGIVIMDETAVLAGQESEFRRAS